MTFGEKLRELRTAAQLSEAKLAELSGVSFGAVHNYGLGLRKPTFESVVKLARALGVTCEAFAECEDVGEEETAPKKRGKRQTDRGGRRTRPLHSKGVIGDRRSE